MLPLKPLLSISLLLLLAACGSVAAGQGVPTKGAFEQTKLFPLTAEAETITAGTPKNGATLTAILATKSAGGTAMAETMTAEPTGTPVPTIPADSAYCKPADLKASTHAQGATQNIFIGVMLANTGSETCFLQTWPQVILVDGQGQPLKMDLNYTDLGASSTPPAATEQAQAETTAKIGLYPGWTAGFNLIWSNWCGGAVPGGAVIRLTLGNEAGTINIPAGIDSGGTCNAPGSPSTLSITKIEFIPQP